MKYCQILNVLGFCCGIETWTTSYALTPQCGNLRIFLSLRFYVKSIFVNRIPQNLTFVALFSQLKSQSWFHEKSQWQKNVEISTLCPTFEILFFILFRSHHDNWKFRVLQIFYVTLKWTSEQLHKCTLQ